MLEHQVEQILTLFVLGHGTEGWADELLLLIGAGAIGVVAFIFVTRGGKDQSDPPQT
jgi:hypothetical protein